MLSAVTSLFELKSQIEVLRFGFSCLFRKSIVLKEVVIEEAGRFVDKQGTPGVKCFSDQELTIGVRCCKSCGREPGNGECSDDFTGADQQTLTARNQQPGIPAAVSGRRPGVLLTDYQQIRSKT